MSQHSTTVCSNGNIYTVHVARKFYEFSLGKTEFVINRALVAIQRRQAIMRDKNTSRAQTLVLYTELTCCSIAQQFSLWPHSRQPPLISWAYGDSHSAFVRYGVIHLIYSFQYRWFMKAVIKESMAATINTVTRRKSYLFITHITFVSYHFSARCVR